MINPPRKVHPDAEALLRAYESTGYLEAFGGTQGVIDASEAVHYLTWVFACLEALFRLGAEG